MCSATQAPGKKEGAREKATHELAKGNADDYEGKRMSACSPLGAGEKGGVGCIRDLGEDDGSFMVLGALLVANVVPLAVPRHTHRRHECRPRCRTTHVLLAMKRMSAQSQGVGHRD